MTDDKPTAPDLPKCPFCDGTFEWNKGAYGNGFDWKYLACDTCEAMAPALTQDEFSEQKAIDICSARAPLDPAAMLAAGYVPTSDLEKLFTQSEIDGVRQQALEEAALECENHGKWLRNRDRADNPAACLDTSAINIRALMDTKETDDG